MNFVRVAVFPLEIDLSPVTRVLDAHGLAHRLVDEDGTQALYVDGDAHLGEVVELVQGALAEIEQDQEQHGLRASPSLAVQFRRTPVMMVCLALSLVGAAVPQWLFSWLPWLTMQDFTLVNPREIAFATLADALAAGQWWRLVTPIFIHFGVIHIVFNGLWLWEFGRRIETVAGSGHFLVLVLTTGVIANLGQYLWSGPSLFGGMSGVIYGLLGYLWVRNRLTPDPAFALPNGIVLFMIGWLLVCMTGIIDLLMQGSVANAAHAAGLLSGLAFGAIVGLAARRGWRA